MSKWNPRTPMPPSPAGFWRDIPNHPGYQASMDGEVRRVYEDGTVRTATENENHQVGIRINGKYTCKLVSRLVWSAFHGPAPEGMCVRHINGDNGDHSIHNLKLVGVAGKGIPAGNRRPVAKVRYSTGEVVELYPSMKAAAEANGCSVTTISLAAQTGEYREGGVRYMYAEDLTDRRGGRLRKNDRKGTP